MIAVEPKAELGEMFDAAGGAGKPRVRFVTPDDVAESIPCGPDVAEHVEKIKSFLDAGFTEIALVQIGGSEQEKFTAWAERELLPALRGL